MISIEQALKLYNKIRRENPYLNASVRILRETIDIPMSFSKEEEIGYNCFADYEIKDDSDYETNINLIKEYLKTRVGQFSEEVEETVGKIEFQKAKGIMNYNSISGKINVSEQMKNRIELAPQLLHEFIHSISSKAIIEKYNNNNEYLNRKSLLLGESLSYIYEIDFLLWLSENEKYKCDAMKILCDLTFRMFGKNIGECLLTVSYIIKVAQGFDETKVINSLVKEFEQSEDYIIPIAKETDYSLSNYLSLNLADSDKVFIAYDSIAIYATAIAFSLIKHDKKVHPNNIYNSIMNGTIENDYDFSINRNNYKNLINACKTIGQKMFELSKEKKSQI